MSQNDKYLPLNNLNNFVIQAKLFCIELKQHGYHGYFYKPSGYCKSNKVCAPIESKG